MAKISDKKTPFLIKIALLFVLLAMGYYKNQHEPMENTYSLKPVYPAENPLFPPGNPPSGKPYRIVKIEFQK